MSETDKPKSRRPSPKHTLDEVLRSLQDLVQNELAETRKHPVPTAWETPAEAPSAAQPPSEPPPTEANEAEPLSEWADEATPASEAAPTDARSAESLAAPRAPEQTSINWDDIPVLNEVVMSPAPAHAPSLPPDTAARDIALKAVARLNIELRKAGNAPLPPAIIDRLEHILREILAAHPADAPARPNEP